MSVSQYLSNLSSLHHSQRFAMPFVSNADYLALQTAMYAATIHLHRDDLEVQPQSYQKCLWAANAMAALVRQLRDNEYDTLCPIISVSLLLASFLLCCADRQRMEMLIYTNLTAGVVSVDGMAFGS